jgi:hypothetical protein
LNLEPTGNIVLNNKYINGVSQPVQDNDAASKIYVDNMVSTQLAYHEAVVAATTGTLDAATGGTVSYNNGTAGVGATLTTTGAFTLIDTANVATVGTRILVKNQADATQNGVYVYTSPTVITRSTDTDTYGPNSTTDLSVNDYFFVSGGGVNAGSAWICDAPAGVITFGTSSISFAQFSSSQTYSAGNGIALVGTVITAKVDNNTTAFDGLGNIIVKTGANLTTPNIGNATGNSLTLSGNGLLSATTVYATGNLEGNNATVTNGVFTATVTASGNVLAGNINSNAEVTGVTVTASGNVLAGNVNSNAAVTGVTLTASGNLNGNNATITNGVSAATATLTGNVLAGNVNSNAAVTGVTGVFSGNVDANNVNAGNVYITTALNVPNLTVSGNVLAGNLNSNAAVTGVTVTASGNLNGNNATITNGVSAATVTTTGNVLAGNLNSNAAVTGVTVTASGNLEGNNATITNGVSAATATLTGNVLAGNLNSNAAVTGVTVTASGNLEGNNATITDGVFSATVTATGNVLAGNVNSNAAVTGVTGVFSGNVDAGNVNVTTALNVPSLTVTGNVTAGNLNSNAAVTGVTVTASGNLNGNNATITNTLTAANANIGNATITSQLTAANITSASDLSITTASNGNITLDPNGSGVIILTDETANRMLFTGANKEINTDANATFDGANLVITGSLQVDNVIVNGADITSNTSELTINSALADVNFRVAGDTEANLVLVDAGTDTVLVSTGTATTGATFKVGGNKSLMIPVGTTGDRPTGVTGMVRFNTSVNNLEFYDNDSWETAGSQFTIITANTQTGTGSQVAFNLPQIGTTAGTIVSINGVVQIPVTAYAVAGNVCTFTEAPESTDVIDFRQLTTTSEVTAITGAGGGQVEASNTANEVDITGNLIPTGNLLYNLGDSTHFWNTLYVGGNSIHLGSLILKDNGANTFAVYTADGTTEANIAVGNIDVTSIASGTSTIGIAAPNGNGFITAGGNATFVVTPTGANIAGTLNATGNANVGNLGTSGNITAGYFFGNGSQLSGIDATSIQSGTSAVSVISSGGNIRANVAGATVQTLSTGGANVTGYITATGNVTGSYILGNGSQLTGIDATSIQNGSANVRTFLNGNATVSAAGTANVLVVTSTGANIAGTLNATGNANVGNIGATSGVFSGNINMSSQYINNVTNPVQNQDVATKAYVDQYITSGITYHSPVAVATTTTLATATSGTVTYNNGTAGVGATLTTTGTFLNIDSANVQTVGTRILVKNEANAAWNGIYTYANTTAIVRSTDADEYGADSTTQLSVNDYFFTTGGVVNEGTAYVVSAPTGTITFGTSNITFTTFSTAQVYDAGTGLTLTGTSFSVNASQTQITSVGTLGSLTVTGNVSPGGISTAGNITAGYLFGNASLVTGLSASKIVNGTSEVNVATSGGNVTVKVGGDLGVTITGSNILANAIGNYGIVASGNIVGGNLQGTSIVGTLTTAAQTNITSVGTLTGLTINNVTTAITNGAASGSGNIGASGATFNTVFAKATTAQYADLAEKYTADADYAPGTVVMFGGNAEVTQATEDSTSRIAGVISTNPGFVMNEGLESEFVAVVALQGRVPCRVVGPVAKGDMMVAAGNGAARVDNTARVGTIIGKALENFDGAEGTIEVVVGRN